MDFMRGRGQDICPFSNDTFLQYHMKKRTICISTCFNLLTYYPFIYKMRNDVQFNIEFCEEVQNYGTLHDNNRADYSNKSAQNFFLSFLSLYVY